MHSIDVFCSISTLIFFVCSFSDQSIYCHCYWSEKKITRKNFTFKCQVIFIVLLSLLRNNEKCLLVMNHKSTGTIGCYTFKLPCWHNRKEKKMNLKNHETICHSLILWNRLCNHKLSNFFFWWIILDYSYSF